MTKKLKFLALELIIVLKCVCFASCSDDDKEQTHSSKEIMDMLIDQEEYRIDAISNQPYFE